MNCKKMIRSKRQFFMTLFQSIVLVSIAFLFLPAVFQVYPNVVLSGSMEPAIFTGSLAYIYAEYPMEMIRPGDVVAYETGNGMKILHRVIEVDEADKTLKTKGDANEEADFGAVNFEQYRGKLLVTVPYAGYVVAFFKNMYVIIAVLCICVAYLLEDII